MCHMAFFTERSCWYHSQRLRWSTTHCRLSTTAYLMCSQLPFTYGVLSFICNLKTRHAVMTAHMIERTGAYRCVVGESEGKRTLGRSGRGWENNIKWIFTDTLNAVMNFRTAEYAANFLTIWGPVSFSRRTLFNDVIYLKTQKKAKSHKWLSLTLSTRNFITLWIIKFVLMVVRYC